MRTVNTYYTDPRALREFAEQNHDLLYSKENRSVLVQVFCGICDRDYIADLVGQIAELLPHAQIAGSTTGGEIMDGKVSGFKTVLSFSAFRESSASAVMAVQKGQSSYELGRQIAQTGGSAPRLLILFSAGATVAVDRLLDGVQSVSSVLHVAGAFPETAPSAGTDTFSAGKGSRTAAPSAWRWKERAYPFTNTVIFAGCRWARK